MTRAEFADVLKTADLIAVVGLVEVGHDRAVVAVNRILAGNASKGAKVVIKSAGLEDRSQRDGFPSSECSFLFIGRDSEPGVYQGRSFRSSGRGSTAFNVPVRHPQTWVNIDIDDLAATVAFARDPTTRVSMAGQPLQFFGLAKGGPTQVSRERFVERLVARLARTPIIATTELEAEQQIVSLELLFVIGAPGEHLEAVLPYLASPHFQVRWACVRALETLGSGQSKAIQALLQLRETESVPPIINAITEAMLRPVLTKAIAETFS